MALHCWNMLALQMVLTILSVVMVCELSAASRCKVSVVRVEEGHS